MGGYAPYVWGSFGLTFVLIVGNILAAQRLRRRVVAEISRTKEVTPKTFSEDPPSRSSSRETS